MIIPKKDLDTLLFRALRAVYQFERTKVSRFGLTYEEIYLLQFLRRASPARMSHIALEMKKPVSTATRLMDRLEKRRLVSREKGSDDRRSMLVSLAPEGESVVRAVEDHTFEAISANLDRFDDEKITAFVETARHLEKILSVSEEDPDR
ncbi:MAG: MarR family transcriptional regulator [Desulfobacterales bacterium]|nr:MarR family transcriptional regulator [Desulfobacterales bacterium]